MTSTPAVRATTGILRIAELIAKELPAGLLAD